MRSPRSVAALQALVVVFIWSTSFVLAKWAFRYGFHPLTLSGIRFGLGALLLTPVALRRSGARRRESPFRIRSVGIPLGLGLFGYAVNTGGYNIGLYYASPAEVAVLLGVSNTLQVLLWSRILLREVPTPFQGLGIATGLLGTVLFYRGDAAPLAHPVAIVAVCVASVGYGIWVVGNRFYVGRFGNSLQLTWRSMASGAVALLIAGVAVDGLPRVALRGWLIVGVLAAVNTAFAFVLWGHTQKVLKSYESVVINNTQTVQVAILGLVFLGERLASAQWIAISLVTVALATVHLTGRRTTR